MDKIVRSRTPQRGPLTTVSAQRPMVSLGSWGRLFGEFRGADGFPEYVGGGGIVKSRSPQAGVWTGVSAKRPMVSLGACGRLCSEHGGADGFLEIVMPPPIAPLRSRCGVPLRSHLGMEFRSAPLRSAPGSVVEASVHGSPESELRIEACQGDARAKNSQSRRCVALRFDQNPLRLRRRSQPVAIQKCTTRGKSDTIVRPRTATRSKMLGLCLFGLGVFHRVDEGVFRRRSLSEQLHGGAVLRPSGMKISEKTLTVT